LEKERRLAEEQRRLAAEERRLAAEERRQFEELLREKDELLREKDEQLTELEEMGALSKMASKTETEIADILIKIMEKNKRLGLNETTIDDIPESQICMLFCHKCAKKIKWGVASTQQGLDTLYYHPQCLSESHLLSFLLFLLINDVVTNLDNPSTCVSSRKKDTAQQKKPMAGTAEKYHQSFLHAVFRTVLMRQAKTSTSDLVLYDTSSKGCMLDQPILGPDFTVLHKNGKYQEPRWRDVCGVIEIKADIKRDWKVYTYHLFETTPYSRSRMRWGNA